MFAKEPLTLQFYKIISISLWSITLTNCSPQGDFGRIIHPPNLIYSSQHKQRDSLKELHSSIPPTGRAGIPEFCKNFRPEPHQLCFTCTLEKILIQRCLVYSGPFSHTLDCINNRDYLKCILRQEPRGLSISMRRPLEKLLRDNYSLWEEAIWNIWESRHPQPDYEKLNDLLRFLRESSIWLSQQEPSLIEDHEIIALLPFHAEHNTLSLQRTRTALASLQSLRLRGKLTLELFLLEWKHFFSKEGLDPNLIKFLEILNLEGLEENENIR